MKFLRQTTVFLCLLPGSLWAQSQLSEEFLSDRPELILSTRQDWGRLGFNTAAHASDKPGELLRIRDKSFTKGLGHHANGSILVLLDEEFASFDAEVGLQPCDGGTGSVVFRVSVDGGKCFDSGLMKATDAARPVHVSVAGGQELFGVYLVPVSTNGWGCIGLQWLNRRMLKEVVLEFAEVAQQPAANTVRVQGWFGESPWQGQWKPLQGEWNIEGNRLGFHLSPKVGADDLLLTQKTRWIFPVPGRPVALRRLSAFTRARWDTVQLMVQADQPSKGASGEVKIYNGELLGRTPSRWNLAKPLPLTVRYSRPSSFKSDSTVLEFRLPNGSFGVAVEDLLSNECSSLRVMRRVLIRRGSIGIQSAWPSLPSPIRKPLPGRPASRWPSD